MLHPLPPLLTPAAINHQWRLRSLEKNPDEDGLSSEGGASSVGVAFFPSSPSSPSRFSSSDWSSSSKSSTSLSDSSASSSSPVHPGSVAWPTTASILSWMAAVTAAVMTSPAIWLTNSRASLSAGRSLSGGGACVDLTGCWGGGSGEGRPRLRSSSSPLVVAPLSSEGKSGRPLVNTSSLSRSVRGGVKERRFF